MHRGSGDAVSCSALAVDIDGEIGGAVVVIRTHGGKAFEVAQPGHQLIGDGVNVIGHNATDGIGILSLRLAGRADIDLQNRIRLQDRGDSWKSAD